jgi:hypothetical protein
VIHDDPLVLIAFPIASSLNAALHSLLDVVGDRQNALAPEVTKAQRPPDFRTDVRLGRVSVPVISTARHWKGRRLFGSRQLR